MVMKSLPDPKDATPADISRYDLTFNALSQANAYQRQLERLRIWLHTAKLAHFCREHGIKAGSREEQMLQKYLLVMS